MVQDLPSFSVKTFIFQNENTYQSQKVSHPLSSTPSSFDIRPILCTFKESNSLFLPLAWKIYDPKTLTFKPLNPETPLPSYHSYSPTIMLKYKQLQPSLSDSQSLPSKDSKDSRKQRNKERTIKEVIECVKKWREVHNQLDKYGNKINLYDAAKVVGIAKKSLDDYFCQLRLAEEYGFDFEGNMGEKVGVLRSFVRKHRGERGGEGGKHERLPRRLRVIEEYDVEVSALVKEFEEKMEVEGENREDFEEGEKDNEKQKEKQEQRESIIEVEYQPPMGPIAQDELQNRFYHSFNWMIDPNDPFIDQGQGAEGRGKMEEEAEMFFF